LALAAAADLLGNLVERRPADGNLRVQRAHIQLRRGLHDEALEDWDEVIRLSPSDTRALVGRALTFAAMGKGRDAIDYLDAQRELSADDWYRLGQALRMNDDSEDALVALDRCLAAEPEHTRALTSRGSVLLDIGETERALVDLDAALRLDPNDPGAHSSRALLLGAQGKLEDAAAEFERRIDLDSSDTLLPRVFLGAIVRRSEPARAIELFAGALEQPGTYVNDFDRAACRAIALSALGETDHARREIDRALSVRGPHHGVPRWIIDLLRVPQVELFDSLRRLAAED
jgi:tetratricopeptide (TPR) repeat protein